MKKVGEFFLSRWFVSFVGVALVSIALWFLLPLIGADELFVVLPIIVVLFLVWFGVNLWLSLRSGKQNEELINSIEQEAENAARADEDATKQEAEVLASRMKEALAQLRGKRMARGSQRYLYELPWYIIIGPPGAGKTTALLNSGLKFPVSQEGAQGPVAGIGGTRNCDWWFTDEAVLIDTAGRYTTQDSNTAVDQGAWHAFLGLLKKNRPVQPINGAFIAVSLVDLLEQTREQREAQNKAIKARLQELREQFGVSFPVYLMFTKVDRLSGFMEFFDDLGREEREQVLGLTFPMEDLGKDGSLEAAVDKAFSDLMERLDQRMLDRLHQEREAQRRSVIYRFPGQLASARTALIEMVTEIFDVTRFEKAPVLRGIYFSSATQEGTPIDRLMSAAAGTFGVARQAIPSLSQTGRAYFLKRLLTDVAFNEASLVGADPKRQRRDRIVRISAYAFAALLLLAGVSAWFVSYVNNSTLIAKTDSQRDAYLQSIDGLGLTDYSDTDLRAIVEPLNLLRTMPAGYANQGEEVPVSIAMGLYQGEKIRAHTVDSYERGLEHYLLPRLILRLEDQMRDNSSDREFLYKALQAYLMLGRQGPLDAEYLQAWMSADWEVNYPGQGMEETRGALSAHLQSLLQLTPLPTLDLDATLIEAVRNTLREYPLAARAYSLIKENAPELNDWLPSDNIGRQQAGIDVFVRRSGKALSEGIPGLFTYDGFHFVFLPQLEDVVREVAAERWILKEAEDQITAMSEPDRRKLEKDILALYTREFTGYWDSLLNDLAVPRIRSVGDANTILGALAKSSSPFKTLLRAVSRETQLTVPPPDDEGGEGGTGVNEKKAKKEAQKLAKAVGLGKVAKVGKRASRLFKSKKGRQAAVDEKPLGSEIEERYARIRAYVDAPEGSPAQIDALLTDMDKLYLAVNQAAVSGAATAPGGGAAALAQASIKAKLPATPPPLTGWIEAVLGGTKDANAGNVKAQLASGFQARVLPFCRQVTNGRYPFIPTAQQGINLADFSRLFAPGGLIDSYFNTELAPMVDINRRPWRWKAVDGRNIGLSQGALAQFERASRIRDSFFSRGTGSPVISFEVKPIYLAADATQVIFEVDGRSFTYSHGPQRFHRLQWPGDSVSFVRIGMSPPLDGRPSALTEEGPWSLFRLFAKGQTEQQAADSFKITFDVGGRTAAFQIRASSVINPFTDSELSRFRCPAGL